MLGVRVYEVFVLDGYVVIVCVFVLFDGFYSFCVDGGVCRFVLCNGMDIIEMNFD